MKTTLSTNALPKWLRNCPNSWNTETLDRDELRTTARAIRQHPKFNEAKRCLAENMIEVFDNSSPINRLLRVEGDFVFLAFVLSLHHSRDDTNPESGASYSRIIELFQLSKIGSPTLIKAMLGLCRMRGYLAVEKVRKSRTKLLVPTDKLLGALKIWLHANLAATDLITPLPMPPTTLAAKPEVLYLVFNYGVRAFIHNQFYLWEEFPEVRSFMLRKDGYAVLMTLIASTYNNSAGVTFASVSSVETAKRLSVSRGTIRNILNDAQENGWLTSISRGSHEVQLSNEFAELCNDWVSMELAWMSGMATSAWMTLASDLN